MKLIHYHYDYGFGKVGECGFKTKRFFVSIRIGFKWKFVLWNKNTKVGLIGPLQYGSTTIPF